MKKFQLLLISSLLLLLFASSCKKDLFEDKLVGIWELRQSGGFDLGPNVNYLPGNGTKYVFAEGNVFERYEGNNLVSRTTYTTTRGSGCVEAKSSNFLVMGDKANPSGHEVRVNGDNLTISNPPCVVDGGWSVYTRIR